MKGAWTNMDMGVALEPVALDALLGMMSQITVAQTRAEMTMLKALSLPPVGEGACYVVSDDSLGWYRACWSAHELYVLLMGICAEPGSFSHELVRAGGLLPALENVTVYYVDFATMSEEQTPEEG